MPTEIETGDLVTSNHFSGIGKVLAYIPNFSEVSIGFFESPLKVDARVMQLPAAWVKLAHVYEEATVYCQDPESRIWRRARYGGARPGKMHLVIFRQGDQLVLPIADIYVLNLSQHHHLSPAAFLAAQANDAPYFCPQRANFVTAYLEQRAVCRSISSIPSSSVELEPHQLAVVRRVLQDRTPKYLLADEVGLGKTIEAGLIIREHLLEKKWSAKVIVAVPSSLVEQWHQELTERFHLGELLVNEDEPDFPVRICAHEDLVKIIQNHGQPTMLVVDEAHQIAPLAWSETEGERFTFNVYSTTAKTADITLLLSGTPLNGNEKNFLAMLHCLAPEAYSLSDEGISHFMARIDERERLGGLHSALTADTPNPAIEGILDELTTLFPKDAVLAEKIEILRPLVDLFASENGRERSDAIKSLRRYIGDHYRLHQRMLRNRRENTTLAFLFPGLAGLGCKEWQVGPEEMTLDELLEEYRSLAMRDTSTFLAMGSEQYLDWIDDLFASPLRVRQRALHYLRTLGETINQEEQEILKQLIQIALKEQEAKDQALIDALRTWLQANMDGKAVVFCSDQETALHVYEKLSSNLGANIERHTPDKVVVFTVPNNDVRVLICDQRGEDGLNLHGGRKLAVHYGIPRSFSRIEQRLGRLNRYSANLRGVKPVQSLAILPARPGLANRWINLLDEAVGLFDSTVASLQYVLEDHLDKTWRQVIWQGDRAIEESARQLSGEEGLLARERKKIKAQEELLAMDEDVSQAAAFADQMAEGDELAEQQAEKMAGWITEALKFKRRGRISDVFRFSFQDDNSRGARTLVDVHSFISTCLTGIDLDSGYPPSTAPMSVARTQVAGGGGVYPFRYGQPFVDAIWDLLQTDSRGISSAILRLIPDLNLQEPQLFFKLNWLASASDSGGDRIKQRIGDEMMPPKLMSHWLAEDGRLPDPNLEQLLEKPYNKSASDYQDLNIRTNVWKELESWFPSEQWKKTVLAIEGHSQRQILERLISENDLSFNPHLQLLSIYAVVLCGPNTAIAGEAD